MEFFYLTSLCFIAVLWNQPVKTRSEGRAHTWQAGRHRHSINCVHFLQIANNRVQKFKYFHTIMYYVACILLFLIEFFSLYLNYPWSRYFLSHSVGQIISRILRNSKAKYHVHKRPQLVHVIIHIDTAHAYNLSI